jgi:hypothetical protein
MKNGDSSMPRKFYSLYILIFLLLAACLQSCSDGEKSYSLNYQGYHVPNPTKHFVLLNISSYQQTTNYTCGPAVIMTLMRHYGMLSPSEMNRTTELRIASEMNTTILGTSQLKMVEWLRQHGFNVSYGQDVTLDMLVDNLNRGIPTIIAWNDFNVHSMLVVGYNSSGASPTGDNDKIFTADPSSSGYIVDNGATINGADTLTPKQLELNQIYARDFFNPSHSEVGMYIVAVPK